MESKGLCFDFGERQRLDGVKLWLFLPVFVGCHLQDISVPADTSRSALNEGLSKRRIKNREDDKLFSKTIGLAGMFSCETSGGYQHEVDMEGREGEVSWAMDL